MSVHMTPPPPKKKKNTEINTSFKAIIFTGDSLILINGEWVEKHFLLCSSYFTAEKLISYSLIFKIFWLLEIILRLLCPESSPSSMNFTGHSTLFNFVF